MRLGRSKSRQRTHRPAGYTPGQWKMISDRSGQTFLSGDIKKEWTGLLVAKHEWEPRHPQEFVRGVVDDYSVRNARPRADLLSTLSYNVGTGFVVERDEENVILRDGSYVYDSRVALGTSTTLTGNPIFMFGANFDTATDVSFLDLNLTISDYSQRQFLRLQHSDDGAVWYDVGSGGVRAILDNLQSGAQVTIPIGQRCQFLQLILDPPAEATATFTVTTFTLR